MGVNGRDCPQQSPNVSRGKVKVLGLLCLLMFFTLPKNVKKDM